MHYNFSILIFIKYGIVHENTKVLWFDLIKMSEKVSEKYFIS